MSAPAPSGGAETGASEKPEEARALKTLIGLDATFHTQSGTKVFAPVLRAQIPARHWTFGLDLPFMYFDMAAAVFSNPIPGASVVQRQSGVRLGNPSLTAQYHSLQGATDLYVGAGIALPLAKMDQPENSDAYAKALFQAVGYSLAGGTRGLWNLWWYMPDTLTLYVPVGVRHVDDSGLDVGGDAAAAVFIYMGDSSRSDLPTAGVQIGGHVGYASDSVEAGLHLRCVRLPGNGGDDHFQASLEPYVRGFFGQAFVGGGFLVNIDEPYGPFLDRGSVWGLRIEGGARF